MLSSWWRRFVPQFKNRNQQNERNRNRAGRALRLNLEPLEDRSLLSSVNVIPGSGDLTYTASAGFNNNFTISVSGSNYKIADPAEVVTLTTNARLAGWRAIDTHTVMGPTAGLDFIDVQLKDLGDVVNILGVVDRIKVDGGTEPDLLTVTGNQPVLNVGDTVITGYTQTISLANFVGEHVSVVGGGSDNTFIFTNWTGDASIDGGLAGNDLFIMTRDASYDLANRRLDINNASPSIQDQSFGLERLDRVSLTGGPSNNVFDMSGWTQPLTSTLDGAGHPISDRIFMERDSHMTLSDSFLDMWIGGDFSISNFENGTLIGGRSPNRIDAHLFTGPLFIEGLLGNDTLWSGDDVDNVYGGEGNDHIRLGDNPVRPALPRDDSPLTFRVPPRFQDFGDGGEGNDTLFGETGDDVLTGGFGNDVIDGGTHNVVSDVLEETADVHMFLSNTALSGGLGADRLISMEGASLTGGVSNNIIRTALFNGFVTLVGSDGADSLVGSLRDSTLRGGIGVDNRDTLEGGQGNDTFTLGYGKTASIYGGSGIDTIVQEFPPGTRFGERWRHGQDYKLSDTRLFFRWDEFLETGTMTASISLVERARLEASDKNTGRNPPPRYNDVFDLTGWTGSATLDGGLSTAAGGANTLIYGNLSFFTNNSDITLTSALLTDKANGTNALTLRGTFTKAHITNLSRNVRINAAGFAGDTTLSGGLGQNTLTGSTGTTRLYLHPVGQFLSDMDYDFYTWTNQGNTSPTLHIEGTQTFDDTDPSSPPPLGDFLDYQLFNIDEVELVAGDFNIKENTLDAQSYTEYPGSPTFGFRPIPTFPPGTFFGGGGFRGNVTLRGGQGNDVLVGSPLQASTSSLFGGAGNDDLRAGINFTNVPAAPNDGIAVMFGEAGDDSLTGGDRNDTLSGGRGFNFLDGLSGTDTNVETEDLDFVLNNSLLEGFLGATLVLENTFADPFFPTFPPTTTIEQVSLTGGASGNSFDVTNWSQGGMTLNGGAGSDVLIYSEIKAGGVPDADMYLTDTQLQVFNSGATTNPIRTITLGNIEEASLTGGNFRNLMDASVFSGQTTLIGGSGNDTLLGAVGNDLLDAGSGANVVMGGDGFNTAVQIADPTFFQVHGAFWGNMVHNTFPPTSPFQGISATDTAVAFTTPFPMPAFNPVTGTNEFFILVGHEIMRVIQGATSGLWNVQRGQLGTTATTHPQGTYFTLLTAGVMFQGQADPAITDGSMGATHLTFTINNTTFLPSYDPSASVFPTYKIQIDNEIMYVSGRSGNILTVIRGQEGTTAAAHQRGALIRYFGAINWSGNRDEIGNIQAVSLDAGAGTAFTTIDTTDYFGEGTLIGGGGDDTLVAGINSHSLIGGAGDDSLSGNRGNDTLSGGTGTNVIDGSVFTHSDYLLLGDVNRLSETEDLDFNLDSTGTRDGTLVSNGLQIDTTFTNIDEVSLTGGASDNFFDVIGYDATFVGNVTLNGGGGTGDRLVDTTDTDYAVSDSRMLRGFDRFFLSNIEQASLTGGASDNIFDMSGWSGTATLNGLGGSDLLVDQEDVSNLTLAASTLARTGLGTILFFSIERASLVGGSSDNNIDAILFGGTSTLRGLDGDDTLIGGGGNDSLDGGNDNDQVEGNSGDDTLVGGAGNDILQGGNGNDTLTGNAGNDQLNGGAGVNRLVEVANGSFILSNSFLRGTLGNDTLFNLQEASLTGGTANNTFDVGGWIGSYVVGVTTFPRSATLIGGGGIDTVIADHTIFTTGSISNVGMDLTTTGADSSLQFLDGASVIGNFLLVGNEIEAASLVGGSGQNRLDATGFDFNATLRGGSGNDTLIGGDGTSVLFGGLGNDSLNGTTGRAGMFGEDGHDRVTGGTGNDTISGGLGNDTLNGAGGIDILRETGNVNFVLTNTSFTGMGIDVVTGFEGASLTGGASNNFITATNFSSPVTLQGLGGNDVLRGGSDDDSLVGGTGSDTIYGNAGNDTLVAGSGPSSLFGGNGDDRLTGGGANDTLSGGAGNNTLNGGSGFNRVFESGNATYDLDNAQLTYTFGSNQLFNVAEASLVGTSGNDVFDVSGWTGRATLNGGAGSGDRVVSTSNANMTLTNTLLTRTNGGSFTLQGIEAASLTGGTGNNLINASGSSLRHTLDGAAGHDTLRGGSGFDSLVGNTGNDQLFGNGGTDYLRGGAGANTLDGGLGVDVVQEIDNVNYTLTNTRLYGAGVDVLVSIERASLVGGASANTFTVSGWTQGATLLGGGGTDTVRSVNNTHMALSNGTLSRTDGAVFALGSIEQAQLTGGVSNNTLNAGLASAIKVTLDGGAGHDVLIAGAGGSYLIGRDGNDSLRGGTAADSLTGGLGNDTLDGRAGIDKLIEAGNVNFTLYDTLLLGVGTDRLFSIERAVLTGGASHNVINATPFTGQATLLGGAGNDLLTGGSGNDALSGGLGNDTLNGRGGVNYLLETADVNYVLTNTTLTGGLGTDRLLSLQGASLTGGSGANTFDLSNFDFNATLNGAGGSDLAIYQNNSDLAVNNTAILDAARGITVGITAIENVWLRGGNSDNTLDASAYNGNVSLTGGLGSDNLIGSAGASSTVHETGDANFTLTPTQLSGSDGFGTDALTGITAGHIIGGASGRTLDGTAFTGRLTLNGGAGSDSLLGGSGFNTLTGGLGNDTLFGGTGRNVMVETQDANFKLTDSNLFTTLPGGTVYTDLLIGLHEASVTGGAGANRINALEVTTYSTTLNGAAGNDILSASDFVGSHLISGGGNDRLFGGATHDTMTSGAGDVTIIGGGGLNELHQTVSVNVTLTNTTLTGLGGGTTLLQDIFFAKLTGGTGNNVFTVSGWTRSGSVTVDGGGGTDTLVSVNNANFTLDGNVPAGDLLTRDTGGSFLLNNVEGVSLTGGNGNNQFSFSGWTRRATLNGGLGTDLLVVEDDASFTLGNTLLQIGTGANYVLSSIEEASLRGGASNNVFNVSGWTGTATLDGAGGTDQLYSSTSGNQTLTDSTFSRSTGGSFVLQNIVQARLYGRSDDNIFSIANWTGDATVVGSTGFDKLVLTADANMTLTNSLALTSTGGRVVLSSIDRVHLRGGASGNFLNASNYTGRATIDGGSGDDTIFGGLGSSVLMGGKGNDDITARGTARHLLVGGGGTDTLTGSVGEDVLISGQIAFYNETTSAVNTLALDYIMKQWTRTDVVYLTRVAQLQGKVQGGLNAVYFLDTTKLFIDNSTNTITGGAGLDWFITSEQTTVTDSILGETITEL